MATEQDCIEALQEAAERLGESPTKAQYEELDITPSASTILRHCGGWNDAKEQAGLETSYSTGSRVQEQPEDAELPNGLVWEELSQDQRWHYRNRDENTQRTLERRQRLRSWVFDEKQRCGCAACGLKDAACLDFHHREDVQKWLGISTMITFGYGKSKLTDEIKKCEVLCANCHRLKHTDGPSAINWNSVTDPASLKSDSVSSTPELPTCRERQRAWVHEFKQARGCAQCGVSDGGCLDLHHVRDDEKADAVSQLIVQGCPGEELLAEIRKCEVLCANCHRKEHYVIPDYVGEVTVVDRVVQAD